MAVETIHQELSSSQKEFESLLNDDFKDRKLKEGEIINATVTEITKNFIISPSLSLRSLKSSFKRLSNSF